MKLELNNDIKVALSTIKDWSGYFDEAEYKVWKELIKERYTNDETALLGKVLGVAYTPCINLVMQDDTKNPTILDTIGLGGKDNDYICRMAYMLYKEDEFKAFGNADVTEPLNYISIDGKDIVHSYFDTIQ